MTVCMCEREIERGEREEREREGEQLLSLTNLDNLVITYVSLCQFSGRNN